MSVRRDRAVQELATHAGARDRCLFAHLRRPLIDAALTIVASQQVEAVGRGGGCGTEAREHEVGARGRRRGQGREREGIGRVGGAAERVPGLDLGDDAARLGGERRVDLRRAGEPRGRVSVQAVAPMCEHMDEPGGGEAGGQRVREHDDPVGPQRAAGGPAEADLRGLADGERVEPGVGALDRVEQRPGASEIGARARRTRGGG